MKKAQKTNSEQKTNNVRKTNSVRKSGKKNKTSSRQLPVSRKFYAELRERVANACGLVMKGYDYVETMMVIIDTYLFESKEPESAAADRDSLLIFALLKPEIDRALRRSATAREHARRRQLSNETALMWALAENLKSISGYDLADDPEPDFADAPADGRPMNRRQRRRLEQMQKREQRRLSKRSLGSCK